MNLRIRWRSLWLLSLLFQTVWLMLVIGRDSMMWIVFVGLVSVVIWMVRFDYELAWFSIAVTTLGIMLDNLNYASGLFEFAHVTFVIPSWLMVLWGAFSVYAALIFDRFKAVPMIWLALIGGLGGVLSYYAGYQLEAVVLKLPLTTTLGVIFVEWVGVTYVMAKIYPR